MTNLEHLIAHILPMSKSREWETARREWNLKRIYRLDDDQDSETCPCTHYPIREICVIENVETGYETEVGNVCVNRFMGLDSASLFAGLRRIRDDNQGTPGTRAIIFFFRSGVLSEWEGKFLLDVHGKRKLSAKQTATRERMNRKILKAVHRPALTETQKRNREARERRKSRAR